MKLNKDIERALANIVKEDHIVQNGVRDALFDSVGPLFDTEASFFPLRPSSALKSMRDLYYDLVNFYSPGTIPKEPFPERVKLIFQFGHLTETLLKKVFAFTYSVSFEQERVKYGELIDKDGNIISLTGSIDWASKVGGDTLILCDAKSIGDYPFKKAPKEENIAQMQIYMHSDWGRANKVDRAQLIYFNKNTSDIKVIEIAYDAELAENLLQRLKYVFECYKSGTLPPREYLPGVDWQGDYSPYKDYDMKEFAIEEEMRPTIGIAIEYDGPRSEKDAIVEHVEKYGNKVALYIDKTVFVSYIKGKLTLVIKEN